MFFVQLNGKRVGPEYTEIGAAKQYARMLQAAQPKLHQRGVVLKQQFSVTGNDGNVLYTRAGRPRVETKEIDF